MHNKTVNFDFTQNLTPSSTNDTCVAHITSPLKVKVLKLFDFYIRQNGSLEAQYVKDRSHLTFENVIIIVVTF